MRMLQRLLIIPIILGIYLLISSYDFLPLETRMIWISVYIIFFILLYYSLKLYIFYNSKTAIVYLVLIQSIFAIVNNYILPVTDRIYSLKNLLASGIKISSSDPHSYFILDPIVKYSILSLTNLPIQSFSILYNAIYAILFSIFVLIFIKSLVRYLNIHDNISLLILSVLVFTIFSFVYSIRSNLALYNLWLFLYLAFFTHFNRPTKISATILALSIVLGSSSASFVLGPFLLFYSIYIFNFILIPLAILPFIYIYFFAKSYTHFLLFYFNFALNGVQKLLSFQNIDRLFPWNRLTSWSFSDTIILSISFLALIFTSFFIALLKIGLLFRWKKEHEKGFAFATSLSTLLLLVASIFAYIGASLQPETTFSDIRTILIYSLGFLIPYMLVEKRTFYFITRKKVLIIIIMILILFTSLINYYSTYPKSKYDPINVVEDIRTGYDSRTAVLQFLAIYGSNLPIIFDYKTGIVFGAYLPTSMIKSIVLTHFTTNSLIVFNINGIIYKSLYIPQSQYIKVYYDALKNNIIYKNNNFIAIIRIA